MQPNQDLTMYVPPHFSETRPEALRMLIDAHPLGALVINGPLGLDANQIPFEFDASVGAQGYLRGHVARANPLWQEVRDGDPVLVIFRASDAYISPNWYPSKHETHRVVPTWNYQVVNVHGRIKVMDDEKFLRGLVGRLTREHETKAESQRAWRMADAPRDAIDTLLKAIVGIEIEVTQMVGKFKLSQNREERDRVNAAEELGRRGQQTLSEAMLKA